jgi:hypothetical protein
MLLPDDDAASPQLGVLVLSLEHPLLLYSPLHCLSAVSYKHKFYPSVFALCCKLILYIVYKAAPMLTTHHSPQSSSFFPGPPPPPFDFIALVPMLVEPPLPFPLLRLSAASEKLSQKSFFSAVGPFGGAPKDSQKSFFSGWGPPCPPSSPSTNRLNVSDAVALAAVTVWPTV